MNEILKQIGAYGVVPVVKIDNVEDALPLGKALIDGGLPLAEITFRTAAAEDATTAGDVDSSTDSSKGSPDTGIEDLAVIGGLAVLAGAAIAFTRKRK